VLARHGAPDQYSIRRQHNDSVTEPASGDELHIMSFNLRYASTRTPNSWAQRRPVMAELLRRERPTVLGTQEGLRDQLADLDRDLPDHDWIGAGRAGGGQDEFVAVFYDTHRVRPVEFDHFWLSDTPHAVGSRSWGNVVIRMVTWVRFTDLRTGTEFVTVNTHFDHKSAHSRRRSAELVRDWLNGLAPGVPAVLTGDFNAPAGASAAYDVLVTGAALTDTWTAAAERLSPPYATFHGYHGLVPSGDRIDWILTRGARVRAAGVNTFSRDGQYPSDHLPVQALITFG